MSQFPHKHYEGNLYTFGHLASSDHTIALNATGTVTANLHVSYSIHCFTEEFIPTEHHDHHRYTYGSETRAFDVSRYGCSLHLPQIVNNLSRAKVYRARYNNYTYVVQIPLGGTAQPYSLFFTLKNSGVASAPSAEMYIQSAYVKPLTVSANAQNWRFGSLLGQLTGVYAPPVKTERPKKKAP